MDESIWLILARLRRAQPRNPDTMAVCEALEERLVRAAPLPAPTPLKAGRGRLEEVPLGKPWEAAGISRRTWYRRREAKA